MDPPYKHEYNLYYNDKEDDEEREEYEKHLNEWEIESDKHEIVRKEFNDEVKRLCKIARKIIFS